MEALPAPVTPAHRLALRAQGRSSGFAVSAAVTSESIEKHTLQKDILIYIDFYLLSAASSKSEGSPHPRQETAGKKSEEKKDFVRPTRPSVSFQTLFLVLLSGNPSHFRHFRAKWIFSGMRRSIVVSINETSASINPTLRISLYWPMRCVQLKRRVLLTR